jgi:hypothetical protein
MKDLLFPKGDTDTKFRKEMAKLLISEAKHLLKAVSSCLVVFVDANQIGVLSDHMSTHYCLHHSVVFGTLPRAKTADGLDDNRQNPYYEVELYFFLEIYKKLFVPANIYGWHF